MAPHAEDVELARASASGKDGPTNGNGLHHPHRNGELGDAPAHKKRESLFVVDSPDVKYTDTEIQSKYTYRTTKVINTAATDESAPRYKAVPHETVYNFKVDRRVPKVGVMLVGWGGNNGTTLTAALLANKRGLTWDTREGRQTANYYGSAVMSSTVRLGVDSVTGRDINVPLRELLPMAHPDDFAVGGWDLSGLNLAASMDRAGVLEPSLKALVRDDMARMVPLPGVCYPGFLAMNQNSRADNVVPGDRPCTEHVDHLRNDIRRFREQHGLSSVVVVWTASTERCADVLPGVNDTADNLLAAIAAGHSEVSPSTVFAVASILEGAPFVNGSPQNTLVPGAIELAERHGALVGGDDFKSGQTKMKSALVEFLVGAGIRVASIASYNHLGNNDGRNLSEQAQFRSKEISKSNVVDDMVEANDILYKKGEHPDHTVVIKYMPAVGDNKRALDEYYADIFMGGHQTISIFNVCEDSLLASPLIIDLVLVAEMMTRIKWRREPGSPGTDNAADTTITSGVKKQGADADGYKSFHSVLSILGYMLKAPMTTPGTPVVNALARQRAALTNIFRACVGLAPESDMALEYKLF